ncbi:MAG: EpsG family protein [Bacteroidota bacterium]
MAKLIFSFFLMFIYGAIRIDYGTDYAPYEEAFDYFHNSSIDAIFASGKEPAYLLLNKIMPSYRTLLVFLSAFTCFTYGWLFYKYIPTKYYWLGFLLMAVSGGNMLYFQLTGLRNAIAINIMTLSIPLIRSRKILPFLGLMGLAYLFHNSVIFYMPLAYFFATPHKIKFYSVIISILIIVALLVMSTSTMINNIAPYISTYFEKYSIYIDTVPVIANKFNFLMSCFLALTLTVSFIVLIREDLLDYENILFKLSLLFLFSFILGVLNFRMTQYFAPYLLVGTTVVLSRVRNVILKYSYVGAILSFSIYSFILYVGLSDFPFANFHTIFE